MIHRMSASLQSAATPQNAIWKATEAIQMINAVTVAKLRPIQDDSVEHQQGFKAFMATATGNPNFLIFSICLCKFIKPFFKDSTF